jgi:hypothetical protein
LADCLIRFFIEFIQFNHEQMQFIGYEEYGAFISILALAFGFE